MAEPIIRLKTCSKCQTIKPAEDFYKHRRRPDGLTDHCKQCVQAYRVIHLARLRAKPTPEFKRCPHCGMTKRRPEFGNSIRGRGGIATYCRLCSALRSSEFRKIHPDKIREWNKRYYEQVDRDYVNAGARRRWHEAKGQEHYRLQVLKRYGMEPEDYEQMLAAQGEGCAICGSVEPGGRSKTPRLHIDHDHETGEVRGLLCNTCNRGLGYFNDSITLLQEAAAYVSFYKQRTAKPHKQTA